MSQNGLPPPALVNAQTPPPEIMARLAELDRKADMIAQQKAEIEAEFPGTTAQWANVLRRSRLREAGLNAQ